MATEEQARVDDGPWWQDGAGFFGRGYMEGDDSTVGYLSQPMTLEERTEAEVEGVIRLLDLTPPQKILDCPCGYGRHSIALAARGFEVVGIDINSEMLARARANAADRPEDLPLRLKKENMIDLDRPQTFDAIVNLFFSFGFFEDEEGDLQSLRNFYEALVPGGRFMMHTDVNIPRVISGDHKFHERRPLSSGRTLEISETYDPESKMIEGRWKLIGENGDVETLPRYRQRVYTFDHFAASCRSVGFGEIEGYGGWNGEPLDDESEDMIVVARKPG